MREKQELQELSFYCPECDGTMELMVHYADRHHQDCAYCEFQLIWIEESGIH